MVILRLLYLTPRKNYLSLLVWIASSFYMSVSYRNEIKHDVGSSTAIYSVISATITPIVISSEASVSSETESPTTEVIAKNLVIDQEGPSRDINLNYFQCLTHSKGFYCFSSDFNYCIAGAGSIPSGRVAVRQVVEHPFNFCVGRQIFYVIQEYSVN